MGIKIETSLLLTLIAGAIALFGILANHRLSVERENIATRRKFATTLCDAIVTLSEPRNFGKDAFSILEDSFPIHHSTYLLSYSASGFLRKHRLSKAWRAYYGNEANGELDWWLPNEYGTIISNKLSNTTENTKSLAIQRLNNIIKICS